jgi:ubiquitin-protein ligase
VGIAPSISARSSMLIFDHCGPQEWHCTLRGPEGTDFEGGLYHFRIRLPAEYPFRPPSIMLLTPNGRFELNTKVNLRSAPAFLEILR